MSDKGTSIKGKPLVLTLISTSSFHNSFAFVCSRKEVKIDSCSDNEGEDGFRFFND